MRLRYDSVGVKSGHYESVYLALVHPTEPQAVWIRTTIQKKPVEEPTGALWVTWFGPDGVRAAKLNHLPVSGKTSLVCGPAEQGPSSSRGAIQLDSLSAKWDLRLTPRSDPLEHLHPRFLYSAPLPRTKATSPLPDLDVGGTLLIDGRPVDLTGWTGMLGHNWGTEHAARWVWLRVCGLGEDQDGWLDAVIGRVRVGPWLAPWTAFGALSLNGRVHDLGGFGRRTEVEVGHDGAVIHLHGRDLRVAVTASVDLKRAVGWEYSDPSGHRHEVVNSSVTAMALQLDGPDGSQTLTPVRRGVLEVGGDKRAFDVPLQPFED
jgi:hypothetical protein